MDGRHLFGGTEPRLQADSSPTRSLRAKTAGQTGYDLIGSLGLTHRILADVTRFVTSERHQDRILASPVRPSHPARWLAVPAASGRACRPPLRGGCHRMSWSPAAVARVVGSPLYGGRLGVRGHPWGPLGADDPTDDPAGSGPPPLHPR